MRKGWIKLAVCAGVAAGFALSSLAPTAAALTIGDGKTSMSLIELAAKKRKAAKAKAVCTQKLIFKCCTKPGQQEYCTL